MKIVQINATCGTGSTGKICASISEQLTASGIENDILYCGVEHPFPQATRYAGKAEIKWQALKSRLFGNYGFNSLAATRRLIRILESISPDIVHLHNLHSHNCNLQLLLTYLRRSGVKVCWTFHDCWAFTAYCPHFDMAGCDKWQRGCGSCGMRKQFSWFLDRSAWLYRRKKELLLPLDLTVISPSRWLAKQVKCSFLSEKPLKVIHNGIDLTVFYPRESDFRSRYSCTEQYLVLGVAFGWGRRKGLDVFVELAKRLGEQYVIVLVGTEDKIDKQLPGNVISIHRTNSQEELAQIYSAADVFVNPTREENYPTVNMEALACGTPVVTFDTGGSPELLDETCGVVVAKNDVDAMEREIRRICTQKSFCAEACLAKARAFDQKHCYAEYLQLYKDICNE